MPFKKGDRIFNRGQRSRGTALSGENAGRLEVKEDNGRVTYWDVGDTLMDEPGADDPNCPGRGHLTDPR